MNAKKRRIDWEALRVRLQQSVGAGGLDPDRLAAVYRQRAAELAARQENTQEPAGTLAVLAFRLEEERFGLELTGLVGVLPLERWTPVPGGPAELLGVINHKGQVCPVLDLARLIGLPAPVEKPAPREGGEPAFILLLRRPGREVGLAVGPIEGLLRVTPGVSPDEGTTSPYLKTLTPDRLRLLSAEALLSHPLFAEAPRP